VRVLQPTTAKSIPEKGEIEMEKSNTLPANYYEQYGREWAEPLRKTHEEICSQEKLENWKSIIPEWFNPRSIIDYGCGNGVFLDLFTKAFGCAGIGIDISSTMIQSAKNSFPHLTFLQGDIDIVETVGQVDIIFFNDVLEHVPEPGKYIREAAKNSKYIAIRIPIEKTSLVAFLNTTGLKKSISRAYESEGHLHELNQREVRELVRKNGFEIMSEAIVYDSRKIFDHPYIRTRMQKKSGLLGKLRYWVYLIMLQVPYPIIQAILSPIKGGTMVIFCKRK
jgi:SAM-dependent methyltransferase